MGTSVSSAVMAHLRTAAAAAAAFALTLGLAPATGFAEEPEPAGGHVSESASAPVSVAASFVLAASNGSGEAATPDSSTLAGNNGSVLASALADSTSAVLSADVALNSVEPLIGSFTVDGLTYSVGSDGLTLVSVDPAAASDGTVSIPETVTYNGTAYPVTSIAPYAFYLSGATAVELPETIVSVDDRAFRSSDVARVEVDAGNPNLVSFDGALYSADLHRLLLIPEGRAGAVLLPSEAEVVESGKFSHCSLVEAISVEEGGANFASWDDLLYDASGTTLLRVPAGAVEITIRDGCTTIAAGALEGCASLERINAPASVISISPDVFTSIPTVSLPAISVAGNSAGAEGEAEVTPRRVVAESQGLSAPLALPDLGSTSASPSSEAAGTNDAETQLYLQDEENSSVASSLFDQSNALTGSIPQLTAVVALSLQNELSAEIDQSNILVRVLAGFEGRWAERGFRLAIEDADEGFFMASPQEAIANLADGSPTEDLLYLCAPSDLFVMQYGTNGSALKPSTFSCTHVYRYAGGHARGDHRYNYDGKTFTVWWGYGSNPSSQYRNLYGFNASYQGVTSVEYSYDRVNYTSLAVGSQLRSLPGNIYFSLNGARDRYPITLDCGGAEVAGTAEVLAVNEQSMPAITLPERKGWTFHGYWTERNGQGECFYTASGASGRSARFTGPTTLYAHWEPNDFELGFDVDSEPGDEDYPGEVKPDETVDVDSGQVAIEDPKRPGYVFEGWVIPTEDGTEAVDQDLVYQDNDGKWYVDASKLPDYAGDDGRVELTARWTSVISVDVPQSVTFYADTVTQNQGSREGAASSAFGQNKVANQSQVDLRVVGLESSAVETTDTTLGADRVLQKADAATPSTSAGKLLSLYPSAKQWTADELQDPEAVSNSKAANAVDFDLDDILLEKSFAADAFTIPAGDTLNMGYRLNLTETGQELDYDKLATLEDGQSAAIANVSYCFAADYGPVFWTIDDDGSTLELATIKADAEKIAAGDAATTAKYTRWMNADHRFYVKWYDQGVAEFDNPTKATTYDVRIIGINHDDKSDGSGKAGLTFQFAGLLSSPERMNVDNVNAGGWGASELRARMNPGAQAVLNGIDDDALWNRVPASLRQAVEQVSKAYRNGGSGGTGISASRDHLFLASYRELVSEEFVGSWEAALGGEGSTYAYWAAKRISGSAPNAALVFRRPTGVAGYCWTRSAYPAGDHYFIGTSADGNPANYLGANGTLGEVAPAFCL